MYLVFGVMLHVRYFLLGMKSSMVAMATPVACKTYRL